jgi:hypothetical protein
MQKFFWRETADEPVQNRYPENYPGVESWRSLVSRISDSDLISRSDFDDYSEVFNTFLADLDHEVHSQPTVDTRDESRTTCCVFISHRQNNVDNALHIAWVATQADYDYWLDIHDPSLIGLNGAQIPSPAKDILLAAIIEIALLNSTHVIALHTKYSIGPLPNNVSKWIPYELGRAKVRQIRSEQAACWFDKHTPVSSCGEYVYLAKHTRTTTDISNWLGAAHQGRCVLSNRKCWPHDTPPPLDP